MQTEFQKIYMKNSDRIELMAPAGNFESLQAAITNGADSVFFGVDQLNMRARASINFTIEFTITIYLLLRPSWMQLKLQV